MERIWSGGFAQKRIPALLVKASMSKSKLTWFLRGARALACVPAVVLTVSMVGFSGIAREAGLTWEHAAFMTIAVWAMPAQIIMVGAIGAGVSLPAVALAVALSSARLLPMVAALTPELQSHRSHRIRLMMLSHFVVITSWVFAMQTLKNVPQEARSTFFAGFAITLAIINTVVVALAFQALSVFPAIVASMLAFLTPAYFLLSLYGSARDAAGRYALAFGMGLLPVVHQLTPEFDILLAGVVAGIAAFTVERTFAKVIRRRQEATIRE